MYFSHIFLIQLLIAFFSHFFDRPTVVAFARIVGTVVDPTARNARCDICGKVYKRRCELRRHLRDKHNVGKVYNVSMLKCLLGKTQQERHQDYILP